MQCASVHIYIDMHTHRKQGRKKKEKERKVSQAERIPEEKGCRVHVWDAGKPLK